MGYTYKNTKCERLYSQFSAILQSEILIETAQLSFQENPGKSQRDIATILSLRSEIVNVNVRLAWRGE